MKFFKKIRVGNAPDRVAWCRTHICKDVVGGNWWHRREFMYFKDERAFLMYSLRWG